MHSETGVAIVGFHGVYLVCVCGVRGCASWMQRSGGSGVCAGAGDRDCHAGFGDGDCRPDSGRDQRDERRAREPGFRF